MCFGSGLEGAALGAQVAGGVGQTYAAYRKSAGEQQGYEFQGAVARNNAQLAEWQAQDAITRSITTRQNIEIKGAKLAGTQRAIFGARNVAADEGSALNILADTAYGTARDANIATDNAAKEAWALRNQALNYTSNAGFLESRAAAQSPFLDAAGTALTTGGKVASSWYAMRTKSSVGTSGSVWGD